MSTSSDLAEISRSRSEVAREVLELGEALYDALIEAAEAHPSGKGDSPQSSPGDDLRAAAAEFFHALRILLNVERGPE